MSWKNILKQESITSALFCACEKLKELPNQKLEAEVLLAALLNVDRVALKKNPRRFLSLLQKLKFNYWIWQRSQGVPVAYIIESVQWAGLDLIVNQNVLIPRDETEILCEHILQIEKTSVPRKVLDIGTGSGCISIFLKKAFPAAKVQGVDISRKALKIARKNAVKNSSHFANASRDKAEILFERSDLLSAIPAGSQFDLIVANLPYVPDSASVTREVGREPASAIFSGTDGLDHIRRLATQLKTKNIEFRSLWLEFLPEQSEKIRGIFSEYDCDFFPDVSGQLFFARITRSEK